MKRPILPPFVCMHITLLVTFAMLSVTSIAWCSGQQNPKPTECWTPEKSGYSGANYGLCRSVCRKHHRLRHRVWSGIFPLEGGFIPDPHFLCSEDNVVWRPVASILGDENSLYSIVDINPFFDDKSSEIALIIRSHLDTFEYSLRFPRHKGVRAILADASFPSADFSRIRGVWRDSVHFFGPVKGFYVIPPSKDGYDFETHTSSES